MITKRLDATQLDEAVTILRDGGLVAFPTETVYGLGGDATRGDAVAQIYKAKGRPAGHPLIVHIADATEAWTWASEVSKAASVLADAFWPGPLTLIVPRSAKAHRDTVGGRASVGLRVPDHPVTLELLRRFGGGLAGPSANRFGHVSPTLADHVVADLDGRIEAVLDGGPARVGVESTIVELAGESVTMLRPGGITMAELDEVLQAAGLSARVVDGRSGESRAAGMLASHYAPSAAVDVVDQLDVTSLRSGDVVLAPNDVINTGQDDDGQKIAYIEMPDDGEQFAERLYAALRDADQQCEGRIIVVRPSSGRLLVAIDDRLTKASTR